ncbi:phage major capsid protein [Amycolatopsis palatopharyngis]|uniref:phage major capsid protein n=1 Tax=Amycolatopsis palatopharyngis TaxID=187982 RepID=UPI000E21C57E|nr:phage major capsid protein [Amycolatopsis palatopharyngis]
MAHPLLDKAARHTAQARAINDEFEGKAMPAEAAHQMDGHLGKAAEYRKQWNREQALTDNESFLDEPVYKHDMGAGEFKGSVGGTSAGEFLLDSERKERKGQAFFDYCRKGLDALTIEQKADLVENATGENLVPVDFSGTILKELPREGVLRNLAFIRPTTKNRVDIGNVVINSAGWGKLETGTVATDGLAATPADKDQIVVHDLNALVKLGRDELEDSDENLAEIIRSALALKFGEMEDDAFAAGSGTGQPFGIAVNADVTQGVTAASGQTVVGDELKKVPFTVPAQFRKSSSAVWMGHTSAEQAIALLKNTEGNYLLQEKAALGEPPTLFGYRWYTVDGLPAITTTADAGAGTDKSVMFGDMKSGYMIADRRRLTVQRLEERYADEGKIGLLFTHRVGGDVIRPKALAWYKL